MSLAVPWLLRRPPAVEAFDEGSGRHSQLALFPAERAVPDHANGFGAKADAASPAYPLVNLQKLALVPPQRSIIPDAELKVTEQGEDR
jgi:hypothetical protein